MRDVRICQFKANLNLNDTFTLDDDGFGHLIRVLRFKQGDDFIVFDGLGNEYNATYVQCRRRCYSWYFR